MRPFSCCRMLRVTIWREVPFTWISSYFTRQSILCIIHFAQRAAARVPTSSNMGQQLPNPGRGESLTSICENIVLFLSVGREKLLKKPLGMRRRWSLFCSFICWQSRSNVAREHFDFLLSLFWNFHVILSYYVVSSLNSDSSFIYGRCL